MIGKISKVGTNWADVETIIDPGFSAGAMVERSKDLGVVEGDSELRYNRQFKLSYLSRDTDIEIDDYVNLNRSRRSFSGRIQIRKSRGN